MPYFRDTAHLYKVLAALFDRVIQEEAVAKALLEGNLIVRFRYHDPEGQATVDLTHAPITYVLGPDPRPADVEMTMHADVCHDFWMGRVNVPQAIATRKIIARGSVPKALKLLPATKAVFPLYPEVLRSIGEEGLLAMAPAREKRPARAPGGLLAWLRRPKRAAIVDYSRIPPLPIPLVEGPVPETERPLGRPGDTIPQAKAEPPATPDLKREMLRRMLLIRHFEETLAAEFAAGTIPAEALHLSTGQEATAVGACFALRTDDYMTTTHRGHGHMLAKAPVGQVKDLLNGMMAEIFGKATGLCKGKGGCMHVTQAQIGALGANGIVGASNVIGIGAAMSAKQRGTDQVCLIFMGDGATAQGMFHEAVNFAAVFNLPAVFLVENNQYAEFTPVTGHTRLERLSDRAKGYGIPGITVDGNDVWAVYQAVREAAARARAGEGPMLIEAVTYRWHGHSEGESAVYRTQEEVERWKGQDPILRWRKALLAEGLLRPEEADGLEQEASSLVAQALAFAKESPYPPVASLAEDIYAPDPTYLWRATDSSSLTGRPVREITCSQALREALAEEMERDPRVYLIGEDVSQGGYFVVTAGLIERFGKERVIDTPISESAIVGSVVGAAMTGMRPVAEIQFSDFLMCCMDAIVNQAAKLRYMSGGQYQLPLVVRTPGGAGIGMAAQHSQSLEALLVGIPGLIIVAPGTPADAKGLLKSAIRSNNPVIFFENKLLYVTSGPVPEGEYLVPLGVADVKRQGRDVTVVAVGGMVGAALEAATELAGEGIEVEVVDPRTLYPCDWTTIVRSVAKTGRLVVVEPGHLSGGFGGEVVARVAEYAWGALRAAPVRIAGKDVPIPYSRGLENAAVATAEDIVAAIRRLMS